MDWIDIKKEKPEPNKPIIIARVSGSMQGWLRIAPCFGYMRENGRFTGCFDLIRATHWVYYEHPD